MNLLSQLVKPFFWTRPFADRTLCHFLRRRLSLPALSLADLFDDFDRQVVCIRQVPRGGWSTHLADLVMLLKLAICARPRRLMEIGSFRGYTALSLAEHTDDEARIVTVDLDPRHGEAYRGNPLSAKIERRVGEISDAKGIGAVIRSVWFETVDRYERLFRDNPPTFYAPFSDRVPMVKGRYDPNASTATAYSWFVWAYDRQQPSEVVHIKPCRDASSPDVTMPGVLLHQATRRSWRVCEPTGWML